MDYRDMAAELLRLRAEQLKINVWRRTAKLTQGELLALYYLRGRDGGAYPSQLSADLSVSTARIAAMLRDMEEKGWIVRSLSQSRHILVTLTEEGRGELERRWEETLSALAGALSALGPEDSAELIRLLKKMNEICMDRK